MQQSGPPAPCTVDAPSLKAEPHSENMERSSNTQAAATDATRASGADLPPEPPQTPSTPAARLLKAGLPAGFVRKHGLITQATDEPLTLEVADGKQHSITEELRAHVRIQAYHGAGWRLKVAPLPTDHFDAVLGMPWLTELHAKLDFGEGLCTVDSPYGPITLACTGRRRAPDIVLSGVRLCRLFRTNKIAATWLVHIKCVTEAELNSASPAASPAERNKLLAEKMAAELAEQLKREFADVLGGVPPGHRPNRPGDEFVHEIPLVEGASPPNRAPYRMSQPELAELQRQLTVLLEKGYIQPSRSAFGAPCLFVKKKDGTPRLVVDYRALNKISVPRAYPLPRIDELLDRLHGARYFTTIDLEQGFHQLNIKPEDVHKSAFRTAFGHYEWLVVPFGMRNAPASFQNAMHSLFREWHDKFLVLFIDDLLIYSNTLEEHREHVRAVLLRLRENQFYAKGVKCSFCQSQVTFLGHVVSADGITVEPSKVEAITRWPQPRTAKELRGFLGLANFYRRLVRRFAHIVTPLNLLLRDKQPFIWGEAQQQAFDALKVALSSAPLVRAPDYSKPFVLHTDASDHAIGAAVMQDFGPGLQPIAYLSRSHDAHQANYDMRDKEMLAIVSALKEWRHYLMGNQVTVYSDHRSLQYLLSGSADLNQRQVRWLDLLADYNLQFVYLKGEKNVVADALSRHATLATIRYIRSPAGRITGAQLEETPQASASAAVVTAFGLFERKETVLATCLEPPLAYRVRLAAVAVASVDPAILKQIHSAYRSDELVQGAARRAREEGEDGWLYRNNLWFIRDTDRTPEGSPEVLARLYVPDAGTLRQQLIAEHHDIPTAGHLGRDNTLDRLSRLFFWPGMARDVAAYTATCPSCQQMKPKAHRPHGLLFSLPIPKDPWEHMGLDLITHLPPSANGSNAIATFIDRLTKVAVFVPCKTTVTAEGLAKLAFREVHRLHGMPTVLISDRDPRFTAKFWQTYTRLIGTKLNMSSAHHPQTDGQTERVHRTLEEMLRHYVHSNPSAWEEMLPAVEFAYNTAKQASTGRSPFYMLYGRHPRTPAAFLQELPQQELARDATNPAAVHWIRNAKTALEQATACLRKAQERQERYANQTRKEQTFKVGDLVLLSTEHFDRRSKDGSKKLEPLFTEPLKVTEVISPVAYRLALPPELQRRHDVFHVSMLEPYRSGEARFPGRETPAVACRLQGADSTPGKYFEVEAFLDSRKVESRIQYLVKWVGYPDSENSWEPSWALQMDLGRKHYLEFVRQLKERPLEQSGA